MLVQTSYCPKYNFGTATFSKNVGFFIIILFFPILIFGKNIETIPVMNRLYVNQAVTVSGNGNTWSTAYKELRDALDYAHANPIVTEIWVAQGTYKPTNSLDPLISFVLKNDLAIYGGFLGNETNLNQRNFVTNITTLSGDLLGDDDYSTVPATNIEENTYHVIFNYYTYVNETAILDGFHVVGGNSNWDPPHHVGGGLYNKQASPAVYNCFFHDNRGGYGGGGIYIDSSALIIQNSYIYDNVGVIRGGGFYVDASTFEITNCLIFNNKSTRYDGAGGGMFVNFSAPIISNTTIANNTAAFQGGGIINNAWSKTEIRNSIIWGNSDEIINTSSSPNDVMPSTSVTNNVIKIQNCIIKDSGGSGVNWNPFYGIDEGNNLEANPDFVDFNNFNFNLTNTSPALNSGNILLYPSGQPLDLDGNPRIFDAANGGIIDIGPFEYQGVTNTCNIGFPCNDNDPCTIGETYQTNCDCSGGTIPDTDNDGICDADPTDNCIGPNVGDSCNDGNVNTYNDVVQSDCGCVGTSDNPNACIPQINLALGKTATQSSTSPNGGSAGLAVDGNTDGDFWFGGSTALTNWNNNTWWEIDLGEESNIEQINIFNRTDCCGEFLTDYYVLVSSDPFTSTNLNTTINQSGVGSYFQNTIASSPSQITINQSGRYVRIQLSGQGFVGLAEVEILGCTEGIGCPPIGTTCDDNNTSTFDDMEDGNCNCIGTPCPLAGATCDDGNPLTINDMEDGNCNCSGTIDNGGDCNSISNIALNKVATQSSTQFGATADRANDGNINGHFWNDASTSLTNWEANAWWEIDLGEIGNIESINIWGRTDCCSQFLSDYHILISSQPFTSQNLAATLNQSGVTDYFQAEPASSPSTVPIDISGRYIRVQLDGQAFLGIAEVEIMGCLGNVSCPPAGQLCDDNNASTFDDMEDGNCNCNGTLCPAAGTSCNDNNANTENDMEDGFCNCSGTPIGNNCNSTDNIAFEKMATQSSTLSVSNIFGSADKALDGNTNGVFFTSPTSASSVSATNFESSAWWQVDLGEEHFIENINVFNRTDGVDKTSDIYVLISNTPFTNNDLSTARAQASYEFFISGLIGSPSVISPNTSGQYIRIQRLSAGYLVLAEVEIEGCLINNSNLIVPDLLNFYVKKEGRQSQIDWMMQQDESIDFYEIEKSKDGQDFDFFQKINAQRITSTQHYEAVDLQPIQGDNFYRLKIIRLNGSIQYSNIRRVNFDIDFDEIQVYPNPTRSKIYLTLGDFAGQKGTVEIYNSFGQKMEHWNFESFPTFPRSFDVSRLVGGIYTISIEVENYRRFAKKFVVVKE